MRDAQHKLSNKHFSLTTVVRWTSPSGPDQKLIVTYGFDSQGMIREAFCAGFRANSDICALANDACILFSRLLQHGENVSDLVVSLGENREEGQSVGPPASLIGAIARMAVEVERDMAKT